MDAERNAPILVLIDHYHRAVAEAVAALRAGLSREALHRAAQTGAIPREGTLGDMMYSFHGIGCRVTREGYEVDFDFDDEGGYRGFDAWRLWQFAKCLPTDHPTLQSHKAVHEALQSLLRSGHVVAARQEIATHLLFLAGDVAPSGGAGPRG